MWDPQTEAFLQLLKLPFPLDDTTPNPTSSGMDMIGSHLLCILHSQPVGLLCTTDTSHWAIFENQKKNCPSAWQVEG
jgi:hypothetical protein